VLPLWINWYNQPVNVPLNSFNTNNISNKDAYPIDKGIGKKEASRATKKLTSGEIQSPNFKEASHYFEAKLAI